MSTFNDNYPIPWERTRGVAAAFEIDANDDRYDFTGIRYNLELPLPPSVTPGCSAVYYPPSTTPAAITSAGTTASPREPCQTFCVCRCRLSAEQSPFRRCTLGTPQRVHALRARLTYLLRDMPTLSCHLLAGGKEGLREGGVDKIWGCATSIKEASRRIL